jgi:hypothetical protein
MTTTQPRPVLLVATALLLGGCSKPPLPSPQAGMPLLEQTSSEIKSFHDNEVGMRFTPPGNWSQQMRSTAEAGDAQGERPVVKYKRFVEGYDPAWLKISILEDGTTPLEALLVKKVPGPGWKQVGGVEQLSRRGLPAAKITFQGQYDQFVNKNFTREILAVRRQHTVFFFAGTYMTSDATGKRRIRNAMDSMELDDIH